MIAELGNCNSKYVLLCFNWQTEGMPWEALVGFHWGIWRGLAFSEWMLSIGTNGERELMGKWETQVYLGNDG